MAARLPSFLPAVPPARRQLPGRRVLNHLGAAPAAPRAALPPAPCRGRAHAVAGGGPRSALCSLGGRERGVAAAAGAGGGDVKDAPGACTAARAPIPLRPSPSPSPPRANPSLRAETSFLTFSPRNSSRRAESQVSAAPPSEPRVPTGAAGWGGGRGVGGPRNCPKERYAATLGLAGGAWDVSGG